MKRLESVGVPLGEIFDRIDDGERVGTVVSVSGRPLGFEYIKVGPKIELTVLDETDSRAHLTVKVNSVRNTLGLVLRTRGYVDDPQLRHPDMYAGRFVGDALKLLRQRQGIVPLTFVGDWVDIPGYDDNYRKFYNSYNGNWDNRAQAACSTWSGRTLRRYGFTQISNRNVYLIPGIPSRVIAMFRHK